MAGDEDLLAQLRPVDQDRYLATLYASQEKRRALAALYLFNAEIASIRDRIHEPLPGEVRIQWWRDAIAGGEGGGHPLVDTLLVVIDKYGLPREAFDRYLDARIFDLYDDPMPSRGDLEGYLGETASALIQLSALVLEPEAAPAFAAAAGHAGCAQGIAGLLRLLPLHRSRGQCFVPADILAAAGTDRDGFVSGNDRAAISRAIEGMVALGHEHASGFAAAARGMPASLRPAFLAAALTQAYLGRVQHAAATALERPADISALRRHWTLLSTAMRGWG